MCSNFLFLEYGNENNQQWKAIYWILLTYRVQELTIWILIKTKNSASLLQETEIKNQVTLCRRRLKEECKS